MPSNKFDYQIIDESPKTWHKSVVFAIVLGLLLIFAEVWLLDLLEPGKLHSFSENVDSVRPYLFAAAFVLFPLSLAVYEFIRNTNKKYKGVERRLILGQNFSSLTYIVFTIISIPLIVLCMVAGTNLTFFIIFSLNLLFACCILLRNLFFLSDRISHNQLEKIIKRIVTQPAEEAAEKIMAHTDLFLNLLDNKTVQFCYTDILRKNYSIMDNGTLGVFIFIGMLYYECIEDEDTENFYNFADFCNVIRKTRPSPVLRFCGDDYENELDAEDDKLKYVREHEWPSTVHIFEYWLVKLQLISHLQFFEILRIEQELWEDYSLTIVRDTKYAPKRKITMAILIDNAGEIVNVN